METPGRKRVMWPKCTESVTFCIVLLHVRGSTEFWNFVRNPRGNPRKPPETPRKPPRKPRGNPAETLAEKPPNLNKNTRQNLVELHRTPPGEACGRTAKGLWPCATAPCWGHEKPLTLIFIDVCATSTLLQRVSTIVAALAAWRSVASIIKLPTQLVALAPHKASQAGREFQAQAMRIVTIIDVTRDFPRCRGCPQCRLGQRERQSAGLQGWLD